MRVARVVRWTGPDGMEGSDLGLAVPSDEVEAFQRRQGYTYERLTDLALFGETANLLAKESVAGWIQDQTEISPRALDSRSIIGDVRSTKIQSVMSLKIKYRESLCLFATAGLEKRVADYFDLNEPSPDMPLGALVKKSRCVPVLDEDRWLFSIKHLNRPPSGFPAVTHLDYSARIQTVSKRTNPRFQTLLMVFATRTGYGYW